MARGIIIGAGRIGRGYMAEVLTQAGYTISFVEKEAVLVASLTRQGTYTVHKAWDDGHWDHLTLTHVEAVTPDDPMYRRWVMEPELVIGIAVFQKDVQEVMSVLGPLLVSRLEAGLPKVNLLFCVNMIHPAGFGWEALRAHIPSQMHNAMEGYVGMADCIVNTTAPATPQRFLDEDPLALLNNGFPHMTVDAKALVSPLPACGLLYLSQRMAGEEMRKIHTVNTAHVTLGYLGIPKGYRYAHEAAADPQLSAHVQRALAESAIGLCGEYGFTPDEMHTWNAHVLQAMGNPELGDELPRLCMDSGRKLYKSDRMVGPALNCLRHGGSPDALLEVIAAAMRYTYAGDLGSQRVCDLLEREGVDAVLDQICKLDTQGVEGDLRARIAQVVSPL